MPSANCFKNHAIFFKKSINQIRIIPDKHLPGKWQPIAIKPTSKIVFFQTIIHGQVRTLRYLIVVIAIYVYKPELVYFNIKHPLYSHIFSYNYLLAGVWPARPNPGRKFVANLPALALTDSMFFGNYVRINAVICQYGLAKIR